MMLKKALLVIFLIGVASSAHADCQMIEMTKLPIEVRGNQLIVPGKLRGEPIRLLADTGASRTIFSLAAVKKAGLSVEESGARAMGVGGEHRLLQATFDDLEIGGMKLSSKRLFVNPEGFSNIAGLLGFDFFGQIDFELNLKAGEMKLFQLRGCDGANLAYWAPEKADMVDMTSGRSHIELPVLINGTRFSAVLDTGASHTFIGRKVADYFGVATSGVGKAIGTDGRPVDMAAHKFESFTIGEETIKNPTLLFTSGLASGFNHTGTRIEDRTSGPDVLLGFDFMRTHRMFVSNAQKKIFFTYEGGSVFPLPQTAK
jgi:predicted aspartyl protease